MTAYQVTSVPPILLNAGHNATGAIEILYESSSLQGYDDELNITVDDGDAGVQLRIADFIENSYTYNVYVWTILATGGLTAWTRVGSTSQSATVPTTALSETVDYIADFVAIDAISGTQPIDPETETEATAAGARRIRVKIRKGDIRPIPPVKRNFG